MLMKSEEDEGVVLDRGQGWPKAWLGQQVSASYQTQVIGHQAVIIIHSFIIIYYLLLFARHTWRMRDE